MSTRPTTDMETVTKDIQSKVDDIKGMVGKQSQKVNLVVENIQKQISDFGNQIKEYLNRIDADIQGYKFSVQRVPNGLDIDLLFKATIKGQKESLKSTKNPP
jgi:predicted phage gp36 major capsid-like protein